MSSLSQFVGGGTASIWTRFFASSASVTIPATGKYRIGVLGGGGSGGAIFQTGPGGAASGGGGGGFTEFEGSLISGLVLTLTVGAGGNGVTSSVSGTGVNGLSGNPSSVTGSGFTTLTANGGSGGA